MVSFSKHHLDVVYIELCVLTSNDTKLNISLLKFLYFNIAIISVILKLYCQLKVKIHKKEC